ncbi:MAG: M20/M25/M40 family metallo-hydrolase [Eubacteriales bacterium]
MSTNEKDYILKFLKELSACSGVSGYEHGLIPIIEKKLSSYVSEVFSDKMNNVYFIKKGTEAKNTIMLAAHMDEIGLMITEVTARGFLRFVPVGGIDYRTLLYQDVIVHGKENITGIVEFIQSSDKEKAVKVEDMYIDIGFSYGEAVKNIQPGDVVSIKKSCVNLTGNIVTGKALDDRAGLAVIAICLRELQNIKHKHNVVCVATVQEEIGLRGAITSTYNINPDMAIAIDVTHGQSLDNVNQVNTKLGKGPVIALGPNIFPEIYKSLCNCAEENRIPYQISPVPGPTGTDARTIQLNNFGVPTGLVSIPLRYMHTSVETVDIQDIINSGKLLAYYIASLPANLEDVLCF